MRLTPLPVTATDDLLLELFAAQEAQGLSNGELARRAKISPVQIRYYRMGRVKTPVHYAIRRVARVLGYEFKLVKIE